MDCWRKPSDKTGRGSQGGSDRVKGGGYRHRKKAFWVSFLAILGRDNREDVRGIQNLKSAAAEASNGSQTLNLESGGEGTRRENIDIQGSGLRSSWPGREGRTGGYEERR